MFNKKTYQLHIVYYLGVIDTSYLLFRIKTRSIHVIVQERIIFANAFTFIERIR